MLAPVLMPYRLEVLGFPRLRDSEGSEIEFPRGKPLALLSFLAVESRPVGRDELGELFWPGNSQKRTRHSVRQAIWLIRRTLGEEILQGDDPVAVSGEALSCDLLEFQGALEAGKVDHARSLWRGPLLSRMSLSGCRGWDHWLEEKRGGLDRDFFRILLSQSRRSIGSQDDEHALECLDQALELNPFSVEAHKLRIETHLDLRQIPRALKALEEAEEEIGDDPRIREELDQLRKRITHQEAAEGSETSERLGESVEFVGRSGEMADLRGAWRRARAGVSGTACILGPTGIGKTRLAAELLTGIERDGGRIAKARGFRGEHRIPWGTVADLIQELMLLPGVKGISSGSEAVLRSVLPSLNKNGSDTQNANGSGEIQSAALSDAVSDLIEAVGFEVPLVIFLDDWQWVDKESRAVLGKAMRRVRGLACLFLLAERTGERRLLQEGAESLVEELGGRRIHLGPLSESELGELLGLLAEFEDQDEAGNLVTLLHGVTGGNPLFVGEVLRKLADDGIYELEEGRWVLRAGRIGETLDLPESVQVLIRERLGRLSPTAAQIVGALARERRSAPVGFLRRRTGLDEAVFTRAMGELVDREVLTWVGPGDVDFSHDQLREAAVLFFPGKNRPTLLGWVRQRPFLSGTAALAAAAILLLGGNLIKQSTGGGLNPVLEASPPDYPFGEGRVILRGDSLIELIPPAREGEEWTRGPSELWHPPSMGPAREGPFRGPDGEVRWFETQTLSEDPPRIVEHYPDGTSTVFFESSGDDGFQDLGPAGEVVLIVTQDRNAPKYRQTLARIDEPGLPPRLVYRADESIYGGSWSPDGQKIAAILSGTVDTLAVLSPFGDVLAKYPMERYRNLARPSWCPDSRHLTLSAYGSRPKFGILFDVETEEIQEFGLDFLAIDHPICMGNGRGALFLGGTEEGWWIFLQDFLADTLIPLFPNESSDRLMTIWLPDEPQPPIGVIDIAGGPRGLEWGDTLNLHALGFDSRGGAVEIEVDWASEDPSIASVGMDGNVTGNRVGTTLISATYRGWLRDTIQVRVEEPEEDPEEVLFRAPFDDPSLPEWIVPDSTVPVPHTKIQDGENILSLMGEGRYRDFIQTVEAFSLQQGMTLEFEFRLPLRRTDKTRINACLRGQDTGGATGPSPATHFEKGYCILYPSMEMAKRLDDVMFVTFGEGPFSFEVSGSPFLPSEDWVHMAIQVRADGLTSIFVNRQQIVAARYPALSDDFTWKIELAGSSVDTELLIRNLTLWRGERFPVDETDADPLGSASGQNR